MVDDTSPKINLFLFQVTPNGSLRNSELGVRRSDGSLERVPRAAIDLNYVLTFFGDHTRLEPQRLLGSTVSVLHSHPLLTREDVQKAIRTRRDGYIAGSDLADEVETIKFTPVNIDLEGLSKLWSVFFQVPYSLSVVYQGSVIMIDAPSAPEPALPSLSYRLTVNTFRRPSVAQVVSEDGEGSPIVKGSRVRILGEQLGGDVTSVIVGGIDLAPARVSDSEIGLTLDSDLLHAGVQGVQVSYRSGVSSDAAAIVLRPNLTGVSYAPSSESQPNGGTVTVQMDTVLLEGQRVVLLLNELSGESRAAHQFSSVVKSPFAGTTSIDVPVSDVKSGTTYLVRVQVDGAESLLSVDTDPSSSTFERYVGPRLDIP